MRRTLLILALLLVPVLAGATAQQNTTVYEVDGAVGADTLGGGFDTTYQGATGVDYTLTSPGPSAAKWSSATGAWSSGAVLTDPTLNTFDNTILGNVLHITAVVGGTCTTGFYTVITFTSSSSITLLRNPCTVAPTSITYTVGGALATIQKAINAMTTADTGTSTNSIADQRTYVKASAAYTITTALVLLPGSTSASHTRVIGYTTTRTDGGQARVTTATASATLLSVGANTGFWIENIDFDCNNTATTKGIDQTGNNGAAYWNIRVRNCPTQGIKTTATKLMLLYSEVTNVGGTYAVDCASGTACHVHGSYIHDNAVPGIYTGASGGTLTASIIANNTGASSDGCTIEGTILIGNLIYGNGRDGCRFVSDVSPNAPTIIRNNIFAKNVGYGLNEVATTANYSPHPNIDYNGYWDNTLGSHNSNLIISAHEVIIAGTDPTGDPFIAKATADWRLNNGAGRVLKNVGFPGITGLPQLPALIGYPDIGPLHGRSRSGGVIGG